MKRARGGEIDKHFVVRVRSVVLPGIGDSKGRQNALRVYWTNRAKPIRVWHSWEDESIILTLNSPERLSEYKEFVIIRIKIKQQDIDIDLVDELGNSYGKFSNRNVNGHWLSVSVKKCDLIFIKPPLINKMLLWRVSWILDIIRLLLFHSLQNSYKYFLTWFFKKIEINQC